MEPASRKAYIKGMKALVLALISALAMPLAPAIAAPLDGLKGKKRVLLLFAKSRSDASLDKQVELLRERRPDLSDRDMIVLATEGSENTVSAIGYTALPYGAARDLKRRFKPSERGLTVILVGKDGGEKQRWNRVARPDEIFDLIDAMPMRQREMEAATN